MDLMLSKRKALGGKNESHLLTYFLQVYMGPDFCLKSSLVIMPLVDYVDSLFCNVVSLHS